ncbi:unnamed protein product [Cylicocyclus nassatus]|uniref:Uncharacterized protein n=1 Tax=Cylicocyclus nassatus TaxID=53992 RepID=A0AA36MCW2_CYLNA|nr:unnamed protein product [Cylicocyclus nassatus]
MMATDNRYSARRQYRSVAFGTWKVGGARMSMERPKIQQKPTDETCLSINYNNYNTIHGTPRKHSENHLRVPNQKLGESSPNLSRLHPTETLRSLGSLSNSTTMPSRLGGGDCYSSTEYVQFTERQCDDDDSCNGNTVSEPIQAAFRADRSKLPAHHLSSRRKNRLENSLQRAHQRSHSAGADASLSVGVVIPCSSDMRALNLSSARDVTANSNNAKFLRATKRFFKKIYSTATLPNKKPSSLETDSNPKPAQFFEIGYRTPAALANESDLSRLEDFRNYGHTYIDTNYPDSGLDMDRSSTPDQSMGSMTVTSSDSRVTSSDSSREERCDDLFETLRREMHAMRARDAAILADLHRVESQIQSVKMARLGLYDATPQPVPSLPI